ncbi:MAG TPA: hypothetical protein VNI54_08515 [Thermoanaerobaculia bacterium]|nr:hypothetical protein [Thermoanaerobaculia bacterium]
MKIFALLLLFATYENIAIHDNGISFIDGDSSRAFSDLGKRYAYFERDGVAYVIHDPATLAALRTIMQPQVDLGRQQAEVGQRQAELGRKQAEIGQRQAELALKQIGARGPAASRLSERQRVLSDEQSALADRQRPLAQQQSVLAEKQREAARIARPKTEKAFEDAIRSGVAKRR